MSLRAVPAPSPTRDRETLEQCWRRLAAGRPSWTLDLLDVVGPHVPVPPSGEGDVARYRDLPWPDAAALLARLPAERLLDHQNAAPSLGSLLRAAVAHPGEVELHGYLVPPNRADERLSAEGLVVYDHPELDAFRLVESDAPCTGTGCECRAFWASVQASFGLEDAGGGPQVIDPCTCRRTGRRGWWLWWT
ncbi:hypothetical protein AB2L28_09905 [Kineococcus sp. TBRC 1896]|uniref:Uncharacterized protein n=1 Tax=Kineococcus mangrovi TaxID=1660183 RepID=A0ABV4I3D5_9ACTN